VLAVAQTSLKVDRVFTAGLVITALGISVAIFIGPFAALFVAVGVALMAIGRRRARRAFDRHYSS
jgi:hypothetical protein